MGATRRQFTRQFSLGLAASLLAACNRGRSATQTPEVAPQTVAPDAAAQPKRVLILGGTGFLGPAVVEQAQVLGAEVTLFNRGKTNPHLFPDLEKLRGDRNDDLSALKGRRFDWVVDTSGYIPRQVEASAGLLADQVERYLFVSSISAYKDLSVHGVDERAPSQPLPEPYSEAPEHYGALKAGCERAAEAAMPGRALLIRPGLIVGPGDPTDRFTYWPTRMRRGGDVLAPNDPGDPVQFVDVRDLATFMMSTLAMQASGLFNVTGPVRPLTVGEMIAACQDAASSEAALRWAPSAFLAEHEVAPWMELTVWVPTDDAEFGGMSSVNIRKAIAAGFETRPIGDTIRDTLAWWDTLPEERRTARRAGLAPEKEATVLAALAGQAAAA